MKKRLRNLWVISSNKLVIFFEWFKVDRVGLRPLLFFIERVVAFIQSVLSAVKRFGFCWKPGYLSVKRNEEVLERANRKQREDNFRVWKKLGSSDYYEGLKQIGNSKIKTDKQGMTQPHLQTKK